MKVRHPPGRAGRPWLAHRLALARRGAELLDEKYRALLRERRRLVPLVADARRRWESEALAAERWWQRAVTIGGERQRELSRVAAVGAAGVEIRWRTVLGVVYPDSAEVVHAAKPDLSPLGGSAALIEAVPAHRRALEAGARVAVLDEALRRTDRELHATRLRRNAIERRWVPAHETALHDLGLVLEELEREDGARVRWVTRGAEPG